MDAYVFEAELVEDPGVSRRLAVRGDQALAAESRGKAPPQYPIPDEEELGAGD
jgi:hypothetical protein